MVHARRGLPQCEHQLPCFSQGQFRGLGALPVPCRTGSHMENGQQPEPRSPPAWWPWGLCVRRGHATWGFPVLQACHSVGQAPLTVWLVLKHQLPCPASWLRPLIGQVPGLAWGSSEGQSEQPRPICDQEHMPWAHLVTQPQPVLCFSCTRGLRTLPVGRTVCMTVHFVPSEPQGPCSLLRPD